MHSFFSECGTERRTFQRTSNATSGRARENMGSLGSGGGAEPKTPKAQRKHRRVEVGPGDSEDQPWKVCYNAPRGLDDSAGDEINAVAKSHEEPRGVLRFTFFSVAVQVSPIETLKAPGKTGRTGPGGE